MWWWKKSRRLILGVAPEVHQFWNFRLRSACLCMPTSDEVSFVPGLIRCGFELGEEIDIFDEKTSECTLVSVDSAKPYLCSFRERGCSYVNPCLCYVFDHFFFCLLPPRAHPPTALDWRHISPADAELCGYQPIGVSGASVADTTVEGAQGMSEHKRGPTRFFFWGGGGNRDTAKNRKPIHCRYVNILGCQQRINKAAQYVHGCIFVFPVKRNHQKRHNQQKN